MNEDEQRQLEDIHETIGQAATYLMNSRLPLTASNLAMALRAQSIITRDPGKKAALEAALQHLARRLARTA